MPYHVVKKDGRYCVQKKDSTKTYGCHDTREEANKQMAALYASEPKAAEIRHLHLVGATGAIRTADYDGRKHIVVPVVALVEGVIWASNAETPEFVGAEELAESPQQWNGRGCFAGHPRVDGVQVSANTPRVLEQSFGFIFNTASSERIIETRRLELEAWLDPAKAKLVGEDAEAIIRRLEADERVEVSVGAFVEVPPVDGVFKGAEYHGAWRSIVSDHLAFLESGATGACSVAAGCGAPRTAVRHLVTAEGISREGDVSEEKKRNTLLGSMRKALVEFLSKASLVAADDGMSDSDVRRAIDAALRADEPGYLGIEAVYPDDSKVVYYVMPADEYQCIRRGYLIDDAGSATLAADREEVQPTMVYEPVAASAATKPCSCGGQRVATTHEQPPAVEVRTMDKTKAAALAANPFSAVRDVKMLEGASDELGAAIESAAEKAKADADTHAAEVAAKTTEIEALKAAAAAPKTITNDDLPADVKVIVAEHHARVAAEKTSIVASLKAAQDVYSEEDLNAMPLNALKKIAALVGEPPAVDYSAARAVASPRDASANEFDPPNPWAKLTAQ